MKTHEKMYVQFLEIADKWEQALDHYSTLDLSKKLNPESWSIGQVYNHLIQSALYFHLKQVDLCLKSADNSDQQKSERGELTFGELKSFPPIKISVPPSDNYTPKQPASSIELKEGLQKVKVAMNEVLAHFDLDLQGKTAHPSFSYLNASEWYQLIEMHWRHHLRQKEELDLLLQH